MRVGLCCGWVGRVIFWKKKEGVPGPWSDKMLLFENLVTTVNHVPPRARHGLPQGPCEAVGATADPVFPRLSFAAVGATADPVFPHLSFAAVGATADPVFPRLSFAGVPDVPALWGGFRARECDGAAAYGGG